MADSTDIEPITRLDITEENPEALVALFPTRKSGVDFLTKNYAWGFARMNKSPEYAGIYIGQKERELQYFGKVKEVLPAEEASLEKDVKEYNHYKSGTKVLNFDSLYKLTDALPYREKVLYPPLRHTILREFKKAQTLDDIL
jgi:hypothetical protein